MNRPISQPTRILKLTRLPRDADAQVDVTVRAMIELTVFECWNDHIAWANDQARMGTNARAQIATNFCIWVARNVAFQLDPADVELVRVPSALARAIRIGQRPTGDCDDMALLLGTMLYREGFPVAYVTIATSPHNPEFRHVFVAAKLFTQWHPYDPSVSRPYRTDRLRHRFWPVPYGKAPWPIG